MPFAIDDPRNWLDFIPGTLKDSPLYSELWEHLKSDEELLSLVDLLPKDQPNLVTFFTAVNFLLLRSQHHPLSLYYPYIRQEGAPPLSEAYPVFREFVLAHDAELSNLLPTARLQTNEVTRCTNLLPAFSMVYQHGGKKPLNMIEIGCSAGLNLNWFRYSYRYGSIVAGNMASPVQITCELQGDFLPPIPAELPPVASCQGIEVFPRDIFDEEDMRWVRAAIWPEELRRHQVLDAAIAFARQNGPTLHQGDASDLLLPLLEAIPQHQTAVVWSSYAVNQGPIAVKERIDRQIAEASLRRPLYRVALEFAGEVGPRLTWCEYRDGNKLRQEVLARCAIHGEWMEWLFESH